MIEALIKFISEYRIKVAMIVNNDFIKARTNMTLESAE